MTRYKSFPLFRSHGPLAARWLPLTPSPPTWSELMGPRTPPEPSHKMRCRRSLNSFCTSQNVPEPMGDPKRMRQDMIIMIHNDHRVRQCANARLHPTIYIKPIHPSTRRAHLMFQIGGSCETGAWFKYHLAFRYEPTFAENPSENNAWYEAGYLQEILSVKPHVPSYTAWLQLMP